MGQLLFFYTSIGYMKLRITYFLLATLTFFSSAQVSSEERAQEPRDVLTIVASDNTQPFSFSLPDGSPSGLYIEFWKLWSQTNNIPIRIVLTSFEEALLLTKQKNTLNAGLFRNKQREEWADFSLPIHNVQIGIIYNRSIDKKPKLRDINDLKTLVLELSFQENYIRENYPDIELSTFKDFDLGIQKLLDNEAQAIIGALPWAYSELAKKGLSGVFVISDEVIVSNNVFALIAKGQPELLEKINHGIENIPIDKLINLEKKWLPTLKPFYKEAVDFSALTLAEKKWLRSHAQFSVAMAEGNYPFEFYDKKGEASGLVADYIYHVKSKLNIDTFISHQATWMEAFELFKQNKIDIISDIVNTPERAKFINFTEPYFSTHNVITIRKDSFFVDSMESLSNKKVGILDGYEVELFSKDYPGINFQIVESDNDGLLKLSEGEIDAYIGIISLINNRIEQLQLSNLMVAAFAPYKFELSMGVRKGLESLVPILNKVFASMTEKERASIANTWLSSQVNRGIDTKTIILWALPVILFLLIITISIISRSNRRLQLEVSIRKKAEQEATHANSAKSEFLSSMSHELRTPLNAIIGFSELLKFDDNMSPAQIENIVEIEKAGEHLLTLVSEVLDLTKIELGKMEFDSKPILLSPIVESSINLIKPLTKKHHLEVFYENNVDKAVIKVDAGKFKQCLINLLSNAVNYNNVNGKIIVEVKASDDNHLVISISDTGIGISEENLKRVFEPFQCVSLEHHFKDGIGIGLTITLNMIELMGGKLNVTSKEGEGSCFSIVMPLHNLESINGNRE